MEPIFRRYKLLVAACLLLVAASVALVAVLTLLRPASVDETARRWTDENSDLVAVKMAGYVLPEIGTAGRNALEGELDSLIAKSMKWRFSEPNSLGGDVYEVVSTASARLDDVLPIVGSPELPDFYIASTIPVHLTVDQGAGMVTDWHLETDRAQVSTNLNIISAPEDLYEGKDAECVAAAGRSNDLSHSAYEFLLKDPDQRTREQSIQLNAALSAAGLAELCQGMTR